MRAKVHAHRLAQRQARQVKSNRENKYVIKVMRLNREGATVYRVKSYPARHSGTQCRQAQTRHSRQRLDKMEKTI